MSSENWEERALEAEAELARQAPLVEAIMKAGALESIQAEIDYQEIDDAPDEVTDIFREALKLRSEK